MEDFDEIIYIDSREDFAEEKLGKHLNLLLSRHGGGIPLFLCIGSDRVTGDSLGPLIGTILKKKRADISVLGTLDAPVHALNLADTLHQIQKKEIPGPVVAIDASLGTREHQGFFTLGKGSLMPGAGVNKSLTCAGDIFLTGIVAQAGPFAQFALQTVRLSRIMSLADMMAEGILMAYDAAAVLPAKTL